RAVGIESAVHRERPTILQAVVARAGAAMAGAVISSVIFDSSALPHPPMVRSERKTPAARPPAARPEPPPRAPTHCSTDRLASRPRVGFRGATVRTTLAARFAIAPPLTPTP